MTPEERLDKLEEQAEKGIMPDCVFFWDGFMSQWEPSPFVVNDITYLTAEHYMMAQKARCFGDEQAVKAILKVASPKAAKEIGRSVANYDDNIWNEKRYEVVVNGSILKFTQNLDLLQMLIDTGDKILVEASPYDTIWGIGLDEEDDTKIINDPRNWQGQNLLGFALMDVRDYFVKDIVPEHLRPKP